MMLQIKDLNKGTFGFVQLAVDVTNGLNYAIKFIERGERVCMMDSIQIDITRPMSMAGHICILCRSQNMWSGKSSITNVSYTRTLLSCER